MLLTSINIYGWVVFIHMWNFSNFLNKFSPSYRVQTKLVSMALHDILIQRRRNTSVGVLVLCVLLYLLCKLSTPVQIIKKEKNEEMFGLCGGHRRSKVTTIIMLNIICGQTKNKQWPWVLIFFVIMKNRLLCLLG